MYCRKSHFDGYRVQLFSHLMVGKKYKVLFSMLNSGDNGRYGDDDVESFLYVCMIIVLVSTIGYVNYAHCL